MLVIKNAQISTGVGDETRRVDIFVEGEKILRICKIPPFPPFSKGENNLFPPFEKGGEGGFDIIDASNFLVLPGAIDPHVHFDTPGYEWREDFAHGTAAAAAGGVTTVIDMPDTTVPPVTNTAALENKLSVISKQAYVDFALWGGVSRNSMLDEDEGSPLPIGERVRVRGGDWFENMQALHDAGVVGFKTYLISGMETFRDLSLIQLGQVMQHAKKIDALIALHAEEKDIIRTREEELKKEGKDSLFDYYFSRSDPAESQGVAIGLHLAGQTKCRLHIVHVASAAAAELIGRARGLGLDVSAETCPQYLHFTYKDFKKMGSLIKCAPVIKTEADREGLWENLREGVINFVATDHAPCPMKEKKTGSCWTDYGGMPGTETMLPYLFSFGYAQKKLKLARLIEVTSTAAAKRFGLYPKKGAIEEGSDADFVIIDPSKVWKLKGKKMHTKARWSPFDGLKFTGQIVKTILRGKVVYDLKKGVLSEPGYGRWVRRNDR